MKLTFKIVTQDMKSLMARSQPFVQYEIGKWTFPLPEFSKMGYGLFCYDGFPEENTDVTDNKILLCEAQVPLPRIDRLVFPEYKPWWNKKSRQRGEMYGAIRPIADVSGARLCIKEVNVEDNGRLTSFVACGAAEVDYGIGKVSVAPKHMAIHGMHLFAWDEKDVCPGHETYLALGIRQREVPEQWPSVSYAEDRGEFYTYRVDTDGMLMFEQIILLEKWEG